MKALYLQIQCRLTHTPVIFPFGNQEGGRNVVRPCCVDLIEAQHSQDRYKVPPTSCQNLTALRPASVRQRCLVYLAGAVGTGWSRDTRIPCKFSLTPYLFKPHISLKPIIYKEPLERWHLERMVLLFHFLPFLGLLLHVDGKVHKRKKVEIKYEYLPQVYKTSKQKVDQTTQQGDIKNSNTTGLQGSQNCHLHQATAPIKRF